MSLMTPEAVARLIAEAEKCHSLSNLKSTNASHNTPKIKNEITKKRKSCVSNLDNEGSKSSSSSSSSNTLTNTSLCSFVESSSLPANQSLKEFVEKSNFESSVSYILSNLPVTIFNKSHQVFTIPNVLPYQVASDLLDYLENLDKNNWDLSNSNTDARMYNHAKGAGSTQHAFSVSEGILINTKTTNSNAYAEGSDPSLMEKFMHIFATALTKCNPNKDESNYTFQCGRYTKSHYIEPHDDMAEEEVDGVKFQRDIAIVLYLSKNWKQDYGGLFIDLEASPPRAILPKFNTLVCFKVPRLHQVTPIEKHCNLKRYSIFGWALKKDSNPKKHAKRNKLKKLKKKKMKSICEI